MLMIGVSHRTATSAMLGHFSRAAQVFLQRGELGAAERVVDEVVDDFVRAQDAPHVEALMARSEPKRQGG